MSDYESDDAPEAVSFVASKYEAIEKFQIAAKAAKEEKTNLKKSAKKEINFLKHKKKKNWPGEEFK